MGIKMNLQTNSVSCLIVTYADRRHLLTKVLEKLDKQTFSVASVVVLFNGVPYDHSEFIQSLDLKIKIHTIEVGYNSGSAEGYNIALKKACQLTSSDYFWMLDDDNEPELEALEILFNAFDLIEADPMEVLLLSLRRDRWEYLSSIHNGNSIGFRNNAFFGFHFRNFLKSLVAESASFENKEGQIPRFPLLQIEYAPYGGLLLHRNWVDKVGLPDKQYYLYGDDHEYTDRITRAGGKIFLCAASRIKDIDQSWFMESKNKCHYLLDPETQAIKAYFAMRNRVATEVKSHVFSKLLYGLNAFLFFAKIIIQSYKLWLAKKFWKRLALIIYAAKEGYYCELRPMGEELSLWIESYGNPREKKVRP